MKRDELMDVIVSLLGDLPADADVVFAIWDHDRTVDAILTGCTPTGIDGLTRLGLTRIPTSLIARTAVAGQLKD